MHVRNRLSPGYLAQSVQAKKTKNNTQGQKPKEFGAMLESKQLSVQTPALRKRRSYYKWTAGKRKHLIELLKEHPEYTIKQYAEALNDKFKDGVRANVEIVNSKLSWDVYKKRPKLRKRKRYTWTEQKRDFLIRLLTEYPWYTTSEYANVLNKRFKDGIKADTWVVINKIARDIHKKKPVGEINEDSEK